VRAFIGVSVCACVLMSLIVLCFAKKFKCLGGVVEVYFPYEGDWLDKE
jgi:hypothetical protein